MQIKKGQNRIVLVFPVIGIAIKFPIIHILEFLRISCRYIKKREWQSFKQDWNVSVDNKEYKGFKRLLLKGVLDNLRECWFYWRTRNIFLQPTYLSFLGIFNIQRVAESCNIKMVDLYNQLYWELTEREVEKDQHHFSNPKNFSFMGGKLRILDYSEFNVQKVVLKYGVEIFNNFDPEYNWEEEKKKLKAKGK